MGVGVGVCGGASVNGCGYVCVVVSGSVCG